MFKEFREFAMRGNVIDLAVGVVIGAAFGSIVKSLVDDIIMPPIGLLIGKVNFADLFITLKAGTTPGPYATVAAAKAAGAVTMNVGQFINSVVSFVLIAFSVFLLVVMTLAGASAGFARNRHIRMEYFVGKVLLYMTGGKGAGVILGARKPIVLTSRFDSMETKLLSIALGAVVARS